MRFKKVEVVARGGIEPPTRGFSVRRRASLGATKSRTGTRFSVADRTAAPDRTHPEPEACYPDFAAATLNRFNGLGALRPNVLRPAIGAPFARSPLDSTTLSRYWKPDSPENLRARPSQTVPLRRPRRKTHLPLWSWVFGHLRNPKVDVPVMCGPYFAGNAERGFVTFGLVRNRDCTVLRTAASESQWNGTVSSIGRTTARRDSTPASHVCRAKSQSNRADYFLPVH